MLVTIERVCPESKAMRTSREMMRESRLLRYLASMRSNIGSRVAVYCKVDVVADRAADKRESRRGQAYAVSERDALKLCLDKLVYTPNSDPAAVWVSSVCVL